MTYPVKGLSGLDRSAAVIDGRGLPDDRRWAIATGALPLNPKGAWTPCLAFQRLTILPTLTEVEVAEGKRIADPATRWHGYNHHAGRHEARWRSGEGHVWPTARLVKAAAGRHETGYWDHADAELSIINLNTVEMIARAVGRPVDPGGSAGTSMFAPQPGASSAGWAVPSRLGMHGLPSCGPSTAVVQLRSIRQQANRTSTSRPS